MKLHCGKSNKDTSKSSMNTSQEQDHRSMSAYEQISHRMRQRTAKYIILFLKNIFCVKKSLEALLTTTLNFALTDS